MKTETAIYRAGIAALASLLPLEWTCELVEPGVIAIQAPDGTLGRVAVMARARIPPGEIAGVAARLSVRTGVAPMVFAGWLSPTSRAALTDRGIGFVDLTGNAELHLSRPGLYVRASGAANDPEPEFRDRHGHAGSRPSAAHNTAHRPARVSPSGRGLGGSVTQAARRQGGSVGTSGLAVHAPPLTSGQQKV